MNGTRLLALSSRLALALLKKQPAAQKKSTGAPKHKVTNVTENRTEAPTGVWSVEMGADQRAGRIFSGEPCV